MIEPIFISNELPKIEQTVFMEQKMNHTEEFQTKGYTIVRGFIDQQSIQTISRYLEYFHKRYPKNNYDCGFDPISKISYYSDPLIETVLFNSLPEMENIIGCKLFPSYSYTRIYTKGEQLVAHLDRPSCEISVTCHVATVGKPWAIWMQAPGSEPSEHYLEPGDACVYHGCEIKHWRDPAVDTDINVQFMLHYVRQDGPSAHYKFDQRQGLGLPSVRR